MEILTFFIVILLPISLILFPETIEHTQAAMGSIRGTYDVLTVALPLPRDEVMGLIPESIRKDNLLLPIDDATYKAFMGKGSTRNENDHLVLLQMGYQHRTGPGPDWMPKFSFNECKLEVPFVRHHLIEGNDKSTPMVYKQTMLFSNPIISISSSAIGIHSIRTSFTPPSTPFNYEADSDPIEYTANGYVQAIARKIAYLDEQDASLQALKESIQAWWFGSGMGKTVQKFDFDFDNPLIKPTPYHVDVKINLKAFGLAETTTEWRSLSNVGWRSKLKVVSQSSTIDKV